MTPLSDPYEIDQDHIDELRLRGKEWDATPIEAAYIVEQSARSFDLTTVDVRGMARWIRLNAPIVKAAEAQEVAKQVLAAVINQACSYTAETLPQSVNEEYEAARSNREAACTATDQAVRAARSAQPDQGDEPDHEHPVIGSGNAT